MPASTFCLLAVRKPLTLCKGKTEPGGRESLLWHLLRLPILLLLLVVSVLLELWLLLAMVRVLLLLAILLLLLVVMLLLHLMLGQRGWRWRGAQVLGLLGPLCFGCLHLFFGPLQAQGNPAYVCILQARLPMSALTLL